MAFASSEPLLLGVCDGPCTAPTLSPFDNKIGGLPDFFPETQLHTPPFCSNCHGVMLHLLQAYCPLEGSIYHRLLHVFCCSQPLCWKYSSGWLVLRSQKSDTSVALSHQQQQGQGQQCLLSVDEWCEDADDWGITPMQGSVPVETNELTVITNTLNQLELKESISPIIQQPVYTTSISYPSYYISVFSANDYQVDNSLDKEKELLRVYQETTNADPNGGGGGECYERISKVDEKFYKFKKEMAKCPRQLIRYQRGGHPLLLQDTTVTPYCTYCGSPCIFELQLLPQIIYLLQKGLEETPQDPTTKKLTLPVVEYGTILVYTCQNSCWSDHDESCQFRKENLLVQQVDDEK